jgi:hypothetical protein
MVSFDFVRRTRHEDAATSSCHEGFSVRVANCAEHRSSTSRKDYYGQLQRVLEHDKISVPWLFVPSGEQNLSAELPKRNNRRQAVFNL